MKVDTQVEGTIVVYFSLGTDLKTEITNLYGQTEVTTYNHTYVENQQGTMNSCVRDR